MFGAPATGGDTGVHCYPMHKAAMLGYTRLFIGMLYSQCYVVACWGLRCTFSADNAGHWPLYNTTLAHKAWQHTQNCYTPIHLLTLYMKENDSMKYDYMLDPAHFSETFLF